MWKEYTAKLNMVIQVYDDVGKQMYGQQLWGFAATKMLKVQRLTFFTDFCLSST